MKLGGKSCIAALLAAVWLGGCAHAVPPPGGEEDREPPRVISTTPEHLAVVEPSRDAVIFRFDERISERGLEDPVLVSPETGAVKVSRGRSELRVRVENGWKPGLVYQVTLLPVVQDMFGNPIPEPVVVAFSTGAEIPNTVVAGLAMDRLTGGPVARNLRVEATRQSDSTRYVAVGDTAGFFAFRYLPPGKYDLISYHDGNRNRRLDYSEPMFGGVIEVGAADTTLLELPLLAQDTTPARLTRAEARDSMTVAVTFDDAIDPDLSLVDVRVRVHELPDSTPVPIGIILHHHEYEAAQRTRMAAARDSADAAEAASPPEAPPDSAARARTEVGRVGRPGRAGRALADPSDVARRAAEEPEPGPEAAAEDSVKPPLPARELVVILGRALEPETRYHVEVEGLTNIAGLTGGGGSAVFVAPKRPEPPDTAGAAPDTTATPPDTAVVPPPDSTRAPPPDTIPPGADGTTSPPPSAAGAAAGPPSTRPGVADGSVPRLGAMKGVAAEDPWPAAGLRGRRMERRPARRRR